MHTILRTPVHTNTHACIDTFLPCLALLLSSTESRNIVLCRDDTYAHTHARCGYILRPSNKKTPYPSFACRCDRYARTQAHTCTHDKHVRIQDQFDQFYNIVHEEVNQTQSHVRNIESQMERMLDTHRNDIRIYLQKVIHLEYEHANNVDQVSTTAERTRETEEKSHLQRKSDLKKDKLKLKSDMKSQEISYEEELKQLKETERKEMKLLREDFETSHQNLKQNHEQRLQALRDDLELRRKMEIHEIEERKNRHINDLVTNHDKAFKEMKDYYNAITEDNLALIKTLNDEIEDLKVKHRQNKEYKDEIKNKNEELSKPLAEAEAEVKDLRDKLKSYEKDKVSLKHAKARMLVLEEQYKSITAEHKMLRGTYQQVEDERNRLYGSFEDTVHSVQHRSGAKNKVLEKMLDEYKDIFQVKKAQFTSVLRASNLDPVVLQNVTKKLDDVLSSKNEQIHELRYETAKVTKAHNDLVRVLESKLSKLGLPTDHLNLVPLLGNTSSAPGDLLVL